MTDCNCETCKDVESLSIMVNKIRDLHFPFPDHLTGILICDQCQDHWPCMTMEILNG